MLKLGGTRIKGDKCFWLWTEEVKDENGDVCTRRLGFMAGHVDDFHRAGNENSAAWKQIKQSIDQRYKWGSVKLNAYRHAGTDLEIVNDATLGRCLVVDQSYYVETLQDIDITPERFCQGDATMTPKEISACRTSLGALQWLAVQTQPLICARCNLLITELAGSPVMRTAQEIQELLLRKHSTQLKFFKLPHVKTWKDVYVVGLGDQAHNNRPRGGSTGGMLVFLAGPEIAMGKLNPMVLVAWKSWKLKRVAISSDDAEVQALVETEDATRLLWAELNGAGKLSESRDLLTASVAEVRLVPGLLGTDSRGGYDSIIINESPLLGLSNIRAALQAEQPKQSLPDCGTKLIWLASDWNLSDGLTKKKPECRESLAYFMKHRPWMLKFDPEFIVSSRKQKAVSGSPAMQLARTSKNSEEFLGPCNSENFHGHLSSS